MLAFYMAIIDDDDDKKKMEKICDLYAKRMLVIADSVLHNAADSEEVVYETLTKIAYHIDAIDDVDSVKTLSYVLKATKNTAINLNKKYKKEREFIAYGHCEEISDKDFVEQLDVKNRYNRVVQAILELDEKYRDVLYYRFVCEMSVSNISDLLGRKKSTVKQQIVRGKKILLENLKKEDLF